MSWVPLRSTEPGSRDCVEVPLRSVPAGLAVEDEGLLDEPVVPIGDLIDAAISDIYGAWLLIHTRCEGAGPALVSELNNVTDQLDRAIRNLQAAALESHALPNWQYRPVMVAKRPR